MLTNLEGKNITLGVTGSIACYKAIDLASKMTQANANVDVILTRGAVEFVSPLTFAAITHGSVVTDLFDPRSALSIDHVALAEKSDLIIVAPATAHTIAKMAQGLADDVLTTTLLATLSPIILAPAMDAHMYDNPATQSNIKILSERGVIIAGPSSGRLASGLTGTGRLLEPNDLMGCMRSIVGRNGDLAGKKIVVSAGGTQETIDPVRVITNHSSGKMGFAIAEAARDQGASTVLVSAPTTLPIPYGIRVVTARSALDMRSVINEECYEADAVIMAAAVADWRPTSSSVNKVKKGCSENWTLELTKNPDIIKELKGDTLVKVGFAAESEDLTANAQAKLISKSLDMIVANDITSEDSGFAADFNKVTILDKNGHVERLPLMPKYEVGVKILNRMKCFFVN